MPRKRRVCEGEYNPHTKSRVVALDADVVPVTQRLKLFGSGLL